MSIDEVHNYWDTMAEEHGSDESATVPDKFYHAFEIKKISEAISNYSANNNVVRILDIGCGNGYATIQLAKQYPGVYFVGIDYSAKMIKIAERQAQADGICNVKFIVGNVLDLSSMKEWTFDVVLTERCLINLKNFQEQKLAVLQMRIAMRAGGLMILVENTKNGLSSLNGLREKQSLPLIEERWHNYYIPDEELLRFFGECQPHLSLVRMENIGNLYYIISRVVGAKLAAIEGREPLYSDAINEIAANLPSLGLYNYSPNFMFLLQAV